jgi:hypothetical protein
MTPFERRLIALEEARGVHLGNRNAFVIFDGDKASIRIGGPAVTFERERRADEAPGAFKERVLDEARSFGGRVSWLTEEEFLELAARLDEEV